LKGCEHRAERDFLTPRGIDQLGPAATAPRAVSLARSVSIAPGGTIVSLFRSNAKGCVHLRRATLLAAPKPTFVVSATTSTAGQHDRTISVLPSLEALSTTVTPARQAGGAAKIEPRHASRSARVL
jgi:hypothetical protein